MAIASAVLTLGILVLSEIIPKTLELVLEKSQCLFSIHSTRFNLDSSSHSHPYGMDEEYVPC